MHENSWNLVRSSKYWKTLLVFGHLPLVWPVEFIVTPNISEWIYLCMCHKVCPILTIWGGDIVIPVSCIFPIGLYLLCQIGSRPFFNFCIVYWVITNSLKLLLQISSDFVEIWLILTPDICEDELWWHRGYFKWRHNGRQLICIWDK